MFFLTLIIGCLLGVVAYNLSSWKHLDKIKSTNKPECLILNYHIIREANVLTKILDNQSSNPQRNTFTIYKDQFDKQMKYLKEKGAYFITPDQLNRYLTKQEEIPNKKCVLITFDDVDESVYQNAFPILKKEGIPSTLFLLMKHIGNKNFDGLSLLDWNQIEEMKKTGLFTFGVHTYNLHYKDSDKQPAFVKKENVELFQKDTAKAIQLYRDKFNKKPNYFAYPYGFGIPETDKVLMDNGIQLIFSLGDETATSSTPTFYIQRLLLTPDNWYQVEEWMEK
jgi:poly-beta-1,6-N-acetyl-D-glucosamine N-deacetylase